MLSRKSKRRHNSQTEGRINFTSSEYLSKVKTFLALVIFAVIVTLALVIFFNGVTYLNLFISLGSGILTFIFLSYIYSHSQTAALKGDTLIMNSMKDRSLVMSVSSVKRIKSKCVMGFCWTSIKYTFDGRTNWIFIITSQLETSPKLSILAAIELKKENKKANHKPGSVITQQA